MAMRKVMTTDASLMGWGAVHEGNVINGVWTPQLHIAHINYLELLMVLLSQNFYPPFRISTF